MESHGIARTKHVRTEEQRQQDLVKIAKYRALEDDVRGRVSSKDYGAETFELTTRLVRSNPEYYTIWNVRRRCLLSCVLSKSPTKEIGSAASGTDDSDERREMEKAEGDDSTVEKEGAQDKGEKERQKHDLEVIKSELVFMIPLLMEFPKCYWLWNHRSWTLQEAVRRLPALTARAMWQGELDLAGKMLSKDRRNFLAWGYRRAVVARLEELPGGEGSMVESEFKYTTSMIHTDLSNFSAWHNRSQLIPRLLDERGADEAARRKFLDDELALIHDAVNVGPEDQSLWYYHQFLILNIVSRDPKRSIVPDLTTAERAAYVDAEIEEVRDLLEDYQDIKWIHEALLECVLAKAEIQGRAVQEAEEEKEDVQGCLAKLKELDPMRNGRWRDMEKEYGLA